MQKNTKNTGLVTIHKENSLIQSKNTKHLSAHSVKILDVLYFVMQVNLNNIKKKHSEEIIKNYYEKNPYKVSIKQTSIRSYIGLENDKNYVKVIRSSLKE